MFKASCPGAYSHAIHLSSLHAISLPRLSWTAHTDQQIGPAVRHVRAVHTATTQAIETPFRKHLKDEAKQRKAEKRLHDNKLGDNGSSSNHERRKSDGAALDKWQLTVGLEIHAQLNTERKLFSNARTSDSDAPNSNVSVFDLAFPGSQPEFQKATLVPALRAAASLSCQIRQKSKFDRKHYYYQDQPAGYQLTQYYEPYAIDGHLDVYQHDGIAVEDGEAVRIGIKQIQMEQDTAKSNLSPPSTALLDFNRVGHPLIEIITHPDIHHPQTAAACVKKIQVILQAVNAVTTGMEMGGLRVDVNVSVSRRDNEALGQRTEIKNLSSFKAIEDAIVAERNRQMAVLESGERVEGETRGWTLGSTETKKLRGKEGEVDYRYMPDPDIPPLVIGEDLVNHIRKTLPQLPEESLLDLVNTSGLTIKDAKTLMSLDSGERLDYFDQVRAECETADKTVANWVLHELGGLISGADIPFSPTLVPATSMASILNHLHHGQITGTTAKQLLSLVFNGDEREVATIIEEESLGLRHLSREEYLAMAQDLIDNNQDKVQQIREKKQLGKFKWFVGQMMRQGEGRVDVRRAEAVLKEIIGLD